MLDAILSLATPRRNLCTLVAGLLLCCHTASGESSPVDAFSPQVSVGFGGCWKLGHWTPVSITTEGAKGVASFQLVAPDCDGTPTVVELPNASPSDGRVLSLTRVGRIAPLRVRWTDRDYNFGEALVEPTETQALAATDTLVVRVGTDSETGKAPIDGLADEGAVHAFVRDAADLPVDPLGYEAVDLLVIEASADDAWRGLQPDAPHARALIDWVASGGRVMLVLGDGTETLVGPNAPLAPLAPGRFRRIVTLPNLTSLARYAGAEEPPGELRVAQFESVTGVIEAHGPGRASDLPLLVRTPYGLGEVLTVAFNLDAPSLTGWAGRVGLLERFQNADTDSSVANEATSGRLRRSNNELASLMRQQLGRSIAGVTVTPFLAIVGGTLVYLMLIGPGDYFFVNRVLRRAGLTWLTFPLIAVITGATAVGIGLAQRAPGVVVNQLELVDIDTATNQARGQMWAEVYSPRGERFDIAIEPRNTLGEPLTDAAAHLGWFGAPGVGLAGMQSATSLIGAGAASTGTYLIEQEKIRGLPINTASTKTLTASWSTKLPNVIDADLVANDNGLVEGTIVNTTGTTLRNTRLLAGEWAWRLGTVADGQVVLVDEGLAPVKIGTLIRSELTGRSGGQRTAAGAPRPIDLQTLDAARLLKLMMFYHKAGSSLITQSDFHYARSIDLSHQLAVGRAILLAEPADTGSPLVDTTSKTPLGGEAVDQQVFYRFVLPVTSSSTVSQ